MDKYPVKKYPEVGEAVQTFVLNLRSIAIQRVTLLSKLNGLCSGIVSNNSLTTGRI
jgi:hypothetical protein